MPDPAGSDKRAKRRVPKLQPLEVRISFQDPSGVQQVLPAHVIDASESGVGLQLRLALPQGAPVSIITPQPDPSIRPRATVRWCRALPGGLYRAGLQFDAAQAPPQPPPAEEPKPANDDLYEFLQVNPKASIDTIHRVYRYLASRFHPDNKDTGDAATFRNLVDAYKILSDPEARAAYDLSYEAARQSRWRIFHSPQSVQGAEGEKRKRLGVLRALYAKRFNEPANPGVTIFELESLLGVPRDHLEFTLWYLKERGMLLRSDNNRFQITVSGIDHCEALEEQLPANALSSDRLLPSPRAQRP